MKKVKHYSKLLHNLINAQVIEFFYTLVIHLTGKVEKVARLLAIWTVLKAAVNELDDSFKWPVSAPETKKLKKLDIEREGLLTIIFDSIRNLEKYAVDPLIKASAEVILAYVENFAATKTMEYEAETAMIDNFVQDLERPENAEHLTRTGHTANLASLKAKNIEFQAIYITRFDARYAHKQSGTTGALREKLLSVFDRFTTGIEGLIATETDPAAIADLEAIVDAINAEIEQFTIIYHRHAGVVSKENDNNGKEDGETQTPDTSLPAAPNTPNQPPSGGPYPLDPNEHPSMGEH